MAAETIEQVETEVAEAEEVVRQPQPQPLAPIVVSGPVDLPTLGRLLVASKYFPDAESAGQAVVKVLAGRELGLGPIASMNNINIVQGHLSLYYALVAALIKRSGRYDYRVRRLDTTGCVVEFFQKSLDGATWESLGEASFTDADARAAGLILKNTYRQYPRNLYFARALTNGARWYCPDVFMGGVFTEEELT